MSNTTPQIPSDFFSANTLFTLSGSACAVWLFCLVLSAIIPVNSLPVYYWRLIALLFSESLAIVIVLQHRSDSSAKWLIGIVNGLLIFINASGINAVSTGLAFENRSNIKLEKTSYISEQKNMMSSFFPFNHEVNWWPDLNILHKTDSLEKANVSLKKTNSQITISYNNLKENCFDQKPDNSKLRKQDSLFIVKIQALEKANLLLKNKLLEINSVKSEIGNNKPLSDFSKKPIEADNNVLSLLKQDLLNCQQENLDMKTKLNKIKKLNQLLKEAEKYNL